MKKKLYIYKEMLTFKSATDTHNCIINLSSFPLLSHKVDVILSW